MNKGAEACTDRQIEKTDTKRQTDSKTGKNRIMSPPDIHREEKKDGREGEFTGEFCH